MFKSFIRAFDEYTTNEKFIPAPYVRRAFELDFLPESAKITIATPGFYELFVNGINITKGHLAPYISNPSQMVCYDEYEVAKHLTVGKNAIGIILGNGYSNQITFKWHYRECSFRAPVSVALKLDASAGAKSFALDSDESFKVHASPIVFDMYRLGTHYDARLEIPGWADAEFDDSSWDNAKIAPTPLGEIIPCYAHPIKTRAEIKPISIEKQENFCYYKTIYDGEDVESTRIAGGYLYDFGINTSGITRLKIKGERGQKISIRHGERLASDGKFNINTAYFGVTANVGSENEIDLYQTDIYTLKGGEEEVFTPPFTYHGFRYAFVEGITEEQATKDLLTYVVFSSDVKKRGDFSCSDEKINKLYAMTLNADLSNFHYFLTDCPHREKNGWTGDASVSAEQVHLNFDAADSLKLWIRQMSHTQREDGMLPGVVPTEKYGYAWGNGPMWDSAAINVPFAAYKYDGRLDVFEEIADTMEKYLKYIAGRRDDKGLIACGLGDWCQPGKARNEPIKAPLALTDTVTTFDTAKKAAMLFKKIGRADAAKYAEDLAAELYRDIRRELIDYETMTAAGNCQTSQAYLIATGIFTEEEYPKAYARLIEIIKEHGNSLYTGMIGLRYIFEVLFKGGDGELALHLMLRDEDPSYGRMIVDDVTALCEALDRGTCNASENHHFFGDIIRVFANYLAGLRPNPTLDDANSILFSPVILDGMDYANAEFKGAKTGWKRENGRIKAYAYIPEGFKGSFELCGKCGELKPGMNEFVI